MSRYDSPDVPSLEYERVSVGWDLIKDLLGGTPAMQADNKWIAQWPLEGKENYKIRRSEAVLFEGFERSVDVLTGKAIPSEITISDSSEMATEWLSNIDLMGSNLTTFAIRLFYDSLAYNRSYILVESPEHSNETLGDDLRNGTRPYWVYYPPESVISWTYEQSGSSRRLIDVRIKEVVTEPEGLFGEKPVDQVRHLHIERGVMVVDIWRKAKNGGWEILESTTTNIDFIPLARNVFSDKPPLKAVAYLNLDHFRFSSEQQHVLHGGCRPLTYVFGVNKSPETLEVGPKRVLWDSNPNAKAGIAEISGPSMEYVRQYLLDRQEQMAVMGAELLLRNSQVRTATQDLNERKETDSALAVMVSKTERTLRQALLYTAILSGEATGDLTMSREGLAADNYLDVLTELRKLGDIPRGPIHDDLIRRGALPGWTREDLEAAIAAETGAP